MNAERCVGAISPSPSPPSATSTHPSPPLAAEARECKSGSADAAPSPPPLSLPPRRRTRPRPRHSCRRLRPPRDHPCLQYSTPLRRLRSRRRLRPLALVAACAAAAVSAPAAALPAPEVARKKTLKAGIVVKWGLGTLIWTNIGAAPRHGAARRSGLWHSQSVAAPKVSVTSFILPPPPPSPPPPPPSRTKITRSCHVPARPPGRPRRCLCHRRPCVRPHAGRPPPARPAPTRSTKSGPSPDPSPCHPKRLQEKITKDVADLRRSMEKLINDKFDGILGQVHGPLRKIHAVTEQVQVVGRPPGVGRSEATSGIHDI